MAYTIYEQIDKNQLFPVRAFAVPIMESTFHWHHEYEIVCVIRGAISMRIQSRQYELHAGDMVLINPNVIHAISNVQGEDGEENLCALVQMSPRLLEVRQDSGSAILFDYNSARGTRPRCGCAHIDRRVARIVYYAMSENEHDVFRLMAETNLLIADLFEYVPYDEVYEGAGGNSTQQLTEDIIRYAEEHLEDPDLAETICSEFAMSRKSLDRNLKGACNVSSKELITSLRVSRAKELLKSTAKSADYIMDVCGFGSQKSFYRIFRQETGMTPGEYRERGTAELYNNLLQGYKPVNPHDVREDLRQLIEAGDEAWTRKDVDVDANDAAAGGSRRDAGDRIADGDYVDSNDGLRAGAIAESNVGSAETGMRTTEAGVIDGNA